MITIVGVGALGSHAALFLRGQSLVVIDRDRVENRNTAAQFHGLPALRRNKALSLGLTLRSMFGAQVTPAPRELTRDNVEVLLRDSDLVVDCCDNIEARRLIQRYCRDHMPCVHGCLSADGTFGRVVWTQHFTPDAEDHAGQPTCEDDRALPFHGMVASLLATQVLRFLDDGTQQSFELVGSSIRRIA
jgi:molybdopterin/thiamine biosynthesis adenylyltransferase